MIENILKCIPPKLIPALTLRIRNPAIRYNYDLTEINHHIQFKLSEWAQHSISNPSQRYEYKKDNRNRRRKALHNKTKVSLKHSYVMRPGYRSTDTYNDASTTQ